MCARFLHLWMLRLPDLSLARVIGTIKRYSFKCFSQAWADNILVQFYSGPFVLHTTACFQIVVIMIIILLGAVQLP